MAWLEGTEWGRGGSVAWQAYDAAGRETTERGSVRGAPPGSLVAVAPLPDGRWLILY
jgi:hypothetical protein